MYTEAQLTKLEEDERIITDEAILAMITLLTSFKSDLETELRRFYSLYGKDGVVTYSEARKWVGSNDHRRRLTVLLLYVNEHFDELQSELTPVFRQMLLDVISKESEFFDTESDSESIVDKEWGVDDKNWLDRLEDDIALWCAYILMEIKQGLLKAKTLEDIITQLNKRFNYIEYVLETLGLSESTAVGSLARQEIFKELGITKYQFYTKPDERRCKTCGAMHGLIFPISAYECGVTASPLHPRCRCFEIPIMED